MADITPITRLEEFIVDAKEGQAPAQNAITRVEMFLAKIAGANVVTPSPITRIETFLASIAGETVTLPKPLTRVETFLAAIAGEDVETPEPITRVEIFLAEWAEGGGGSVVKTITGEAPLTFTALAAALVSLTQDGKCVQDGTPTPSSPVDIVCNNGTLMMVDDELPIGYKRIASIKFDGDIHYETGEALLGDDDVTMTLDDTSTTGQNIFGSYNGTSSGAVNFSLFIYGGGSASGSYFRYGTQLLRPRYGSGERTITFGKSGTDGFLTDATATPDTFTTPANAYIGMLPNSTSPAYTGTIVGNITVGTRLKWIPCERTADGAVGYYEAVNGNFIAPTGTGTATKGAYDYTHAHLEVVGTPEVLSVGGKNWFGLNASPSDRTYLDSTGGTGTSANWTLSDFIAVNPATEYTFNPNSTAGASAKVGYFTAEQTFISAIDSGLQTFTTPNNCFFMRFSYRNESSNIQLEVGSTATDYEPYRTPQTASVADLFAVGNSKDTHELIGGTVKHKVGIKVFDGTETFSTSTAYGKAFLINAAAASWGADRTGSVLCTHFLGLPQSAGSQADNTCFFNQTGHFYFRVTDNSDTAAFKAWLKAQYDNGTPVIVLYPLAEETTESVHGQALHTSKGTNTISVISEVDPVTLTAEYKAPKEA